jgi:hypothetical protein
MHCRVGSSGRSARLDFVSSCISGPLPYVSGLNFWLRDEPVPTACRFCLPDVSAEWVAWLGERQQAFSNGLRVTPLALGGPYALLQADAEDGSASVTCLFAGLADPALVRCADQP